MTPSQSKYGNEYNISKSIIVTEEMKESIQDFDCGNEALNSYLKEKSYNDPRAVTFVIKDKDSDKIVCYYTLNCTALVINPTEKSDIVLCPSVEIKMFAVDENYQHIAYSQDPDDGSLSDLLLADAISRIYDFTENQCGADKITLHAVPKAVNFYAKNGFRLFEDYMIPVLDWFTEGCIPMYMDL